MDKEFIKHTIEEFVEAKFEGSGAEPTTVMLHKYDGRAHWFIWFDEKTDWIYITAGPSEYIDPNPVVEAVIFCDGVHIEYFSEGQQYLWFKPVGSPLSNSVTMLSKIATGGNQHPFQYTLAPVVGIDRTQSADA